MATRNLHLLLLKNGRTIAIHNYRTYVFQYPSISWFTSRNRSSHIASSQRNHSVSLSIVKPFHEITQTSGVKRGQFLNFCGARLASTFVVETAGKLTNTVAEHQETSATVSASITVPTSSSVIIDPIPEPPPIPVVETSAETVNAAAESSFAILGLGGWSPVGIVENCMEFLHVDCGVPWWTSIILGTLVVRIILFPVVVISQRHAAKLNNALPQLQVLQGKMSEARQTGNNLEAARYSQELMLFMKEKQINPLKSMLVPLAQAPIFISFFMALREMSNIPVPDMVTGGLWWFTDLTVPDQYFILPLLTSATLFATIELGVDSARLNAQNSHAMKYFLRALPLCIFPFTMNFPGAVLCYWLSSNAISLIQVGVIKLPAVRSILKIDPLIRHDPNALPNKPKGFVEGFKESYTNMKITKEMEERERYDEMQFRRAGTAPIRKTFKYDPTLSREAVSAKKSGTP